MQMSETFFGTHCWSCTAQDAATRGFCALHAPALGAPQHALPLVVVMRRDDVALGEGTQRESQTYVPKTATLFGQFLFDCV